MILSPLPLIVPAPCKIPFSINNPKIINWIFENYSLALFSNGAILQSVCCYFISSSQTITFDVTSSVSTINAFAL